MTWDDIWEKKGNENTTDLKTLNGFDVCNFKFTADDTVNNIIKYCNICVSDKILEIGSGAGRLGKIFLNKKYDYYAIERSKSLVNKFKLLIDKNKIELNTTNILPFKDNSFDIVFCWSIVQYFDSVEDFNLLLTEMKRVSKKTILIGDIYESKNKIQKDYKYDYQDLKHLCIPKKTFENNDDISSNKYRICQFNNSDSTRYNYLLYLNK